MNPTQPDGLGALADPHQYRKALAIGTLPADTLIQRLQSMIAIRAAEEAIADLSQSGEAKCPCHLSIGQEAIPVGISAHLHPTDRIFGGHRSHGHYLALGGDLLGLMAEILGRETGCAGGRGGSMHLYDEACGFFGSVPIVGGTVPVAVGAALAAKMDGKGTIAVAYFGDGAIEEGTVQESLNLASVMKLPILFVCENNFYSSHLDIALRQPSERITRFAEAHRIAAETIDGNDVVTVEARAGEMIARIRAGNGPGFLETVTYRWRGHVGPREDVDVGIRRSLQDLHDWKQRDPIRRLTDALTIRGDLAPGAVKTMFDDAKTLMADTVRTALAAPLPDPATLMDHVYSAAPAH